MDEPTGQPRRCGAKTRGARGGRPCARYPMKGRTRCRLHGGASTGPRKANNTNAATHGLYARSLTEKERAVFDAALSEQKADPLGVLRRDQALIATKVTSLLERTTPDGMLLVERSRGGPSGTVEKLVDVTVPLARALEAKARIAATARHEPPGSGPNSVDGDATDVTEAERAELLAIAAWAVREHLAKLTAAALGLSDSELVTTLYKQTSGAPAVRAELRRQGESWLESILDAEEEDEDGTQED